MNMVLAHTGGEWPAVRGKTGWPWTEETDPAIYRQRGDWPKISIVTPSFNQGAFIEETIRSVLLQNYPNLEYIVMDGGSSDGTLEIIQKYSPWLSYWTSERDKGQADAINRGFSRSTGRILNWLNSDDYLLPGALFHVGRFSWTRETGAVVGRGHKVDLQGRVTYTPKSRELGYEAFLRWMQGNNFMQPSCYFSREAWEECGPLDESLNFCMDVDLWLKIARRFRFERLDKDLSHAYAHQDAKTTALSTESRIETAFLIYANGDKELAAAEIKRLIADLGKDRGARGFLKKVRRKLALLRKKS